MVRVETPSHCRWLIAKDMSLAMPVLPKCGSTSLKTNPAFLPHVSAEEVLAIPVRVAWIRHPIKRLHSIWRESHMRNPDNSFRWMLAHTEDPEDIPGWTVFIDIVLTISNAHWNPQIPQLTYGEYLPTISERFENLATRFNEYLPGELSWSNRSDPREADFSYRRQEIEDRYKADLDLWESIDG